MNPMRRPRVRLVPSRRHQWAYRMALAAVAIGFRSAVVAQTTGPSSSQSPYLVPLDVRTSFTSVLTTGDAVGGYRMAGIPDGLGAFDNGDGTFTVLMNHELTSTYSAAGVSYSTPVRDHGGNGAFISEWVIDKSTLEVKSGADLMQRVYGLSGNTWNAVSGSALNFSRFCSADLAAPSAFYDAATGLGTTARIFLNGEEQGNARGLAHVATGADKGSSYLLPWAGPSSNPSQQQSWENFLANPNSGAKTLVIGNSDGGNNGLVVYVGNKSATGLEVEKAGLVGGQVYRVAVNGNAAESRAGDAGFGLANGAATFSLVGGTGNALIDRGTGTSFLRPEDGAWDTKDARRYYFVTTDRMDATKDAGANPDIPGSQAGRSRLWSLTFDDLAHPENGGTIRMLLDGTTADGAYQMLDNLTVNPDGTLFLQEDVGNNAHNGKIWRYDPATDSLALVAGHDTTRFGDIGIVPTLTKDEESSGAIDITGILGRNDGNLYTLLDVQNHTVSTDSALQEGGQLLLMSTHVPDGGGVLGWLGVLVLVDVARRRRSAASR